MIRIVYNLKLIKKMKRKRSKAIRIVKLLLIYAGLLFIPLNLNAEDPEFYTIQTGSFLEIQIAQKQFDSIQKGLNNQELGLLRIEKIGKYYSVRIGKFPDYSSASTFLQTNKSELKGAIILKAAISEERIIQLYAAESPERAVQPSEKSLPKESDTVKNVLGVQNPVPAAGPSADTAGAAGAGTESKDTHLLQQPAPGTEPSTSVPSLSPVSMEMGKESATLKKSSDDGRAGIFSGTKGRFYVSDYYSNDSDDFEFHILTSRVNLYKYEDNESTYYYSLDARVRKKIFNGDMKENVPEWKVDEAWLGVKFPKLNLNVIGGRQDIYELYNTTIDGLNVKYSFSNGLGFGVFGGLAPDKQDESLNADYKSYGGYTFLNHEKHKVQFGYENLSYKGDTDREYFSLRIFSKLHEKVRLNAVSSASINQLTNNFEVENANVNLLYAYSGSLRFNVFYNYFQTIKYYESTREYLELPDVAESFFLDNNSRTQTGVRVDYRVMKGLKLYSSVAYEKRKLDGEDKLRLTGGFRKYDLYGFDVSGRYTYIDDFTATSDEFNAEISRNFFSKVDLSLYASREEKKLDTENAFTKRALTYGSSVYWMINRHYFMTAFLERYKDEDYINTSVFSQLGYKL